MLLTRVFIDFLHLRQALQVVENGWVKRELDAFNRYHGSEFAGKMLDKWVYARGIRIDFSRPGTPTDNATVESFNGRLRQESPERKLVHVAGGCTVQNRSLAHTL
ncbi:transposase family protein [Citrobacter sp. RHBSTW-00524]|nr:transposase family protein [Citrobacter sp. RHBSTW-00524]